MRIYHAISGNGYNWTLDPDNPIFQVSEVEDYVDPESIYYNGEQYFMSYLRGYIYEWDFNLATSYDLYTWEEYENNPVFTPGPSGSWEETIGRACILYDSAENKYKMWYMGGDSEDVSIGYATSEAVGIQNTSTGQIRVYPNPVQTFLTIQTAYPGLSNIKFTSLNGQVILNKEMEGPIHQLDLSSFHKGVYFITIRSKDLVTTRKIVKL